MIRVAAAQAVRRAPTCGAKGRIENRRDCSPAHAALLSSYRRTRHAAQSPSDRAEADEHHRPCREFRDGRWGGEVAVLEGCAVAKMPDNLSQIIDAAGLGKAATSTNSAGNIEGNEPAVAVAEEAVGSAGFIDKIPDDLSQIIDAVGLGKRGFGYIDSREGAVGVQKPVIGQPVNALVVPKDPDDLSPIVDASGVRKGSGAGIIEGREGAVGVKEPALAAQPRGRRIIKKGPDDLSPVVDAEGAI